MDNYDLLSGDISFGEHKWYNGPQPLFQQTCGNEPNSFQGSHLIYHQPYINEPIVYPDPWYLHPEKFSIVEQDINLMCYPPNGNESSESRNSYSCLYRKDPFKSEGLREQFIQSYKLPLDYYQGTYPINVQLPDVVPSINVDILSENQNFSADIDESLEDACLINKSGDSETSAIKELHQPLPQPAESNSDGDRHMDSNIHQTSEKKSVLPESSHPNYSGSNINQKTYLRHGNSSGSNFNSILNGNRPFPIVESNSGKLLNSSSSEVSKCELNGTDQSNLVIGSDPDIIIIKDFHNRSVSISDKTERLNSREKFHTGQDLQQSSHQASNTEASENQKSGTIIRHLQQNNSDKHRLTNPWDHLEFTNNTNSIAFTKKHTKSDLRTSKVASKKNRGLNSCTLLGDTFVSILDLLGLLQTLSKSDPDCAMDVTIYIVGLGNCDATRLFKTFARKEIDQMVFETKLKLSGMTLEIKTRCFRNSDNFSSLRTFSESSRNVIVLVYDVTRVFDVHAITIKIKFLKLTNLPILLIGNTSELTGNRPKSRLVLYKDGQIMKDIYKLSFFSECSIESVVEVNNLFITAIDLAFRYRL